MLRGLLLRLAASCLFLTLAIPSVSAQKVLPDAVNDLATQIAKNVAKEQKTKIAVIPFRELGGQPTVFGTYVAEELVTDLVNIGGLDLVERTTLDKVMGELRLNESGAVDPATAKQIGKLVGADAIVTGTITDLQSYVGVNCRLVDTQTGRIFAAAQARIVKDDDVKKILGTAMSQGASIEKKQPPMPVLQDSRPGFETDTYKLFADSLKKVGADATLVLTLEAVADKEIIFRIQSRSCYLLDESGERWNVDYRADSGNFTSFYGVLLSPGTKVKSRFRFTAQDNNQGTKFTLTCPETLPNSRIITVRGISAQ